MKHKLFIFTPLIVFLTILPSVSAHCPLCTMGAMAAAAGASALGVSNAIIGVFTGAFAVSTGWWISNKLKKKYIPGQKWLLITASFLLTIIPVMFVIQDYYAIYIGWSGDYGSILNRTYILNKILIGSIFGGAMLFVTPWLSQKITAWRGKMIPYQGVLLTFLCLLIISGLFQLFLR